MRVPMVTSLAALVVVVSACGSSGASETAEPAGGRDGAALFAANCAACHGADATGTSTGPPLIHEFYVPSHHADASFLLAVQRGVQPHHWDFGPMPAVPGLDAADVQAIVDHVRGLQREAGLIP